MDEVFAAKGLSVGYRGKALIRDISFSLRAGQILTLIGPNGAGKSTILKTLVGQLEAVSGDVFICGRTLGEWPRNELARRLAVVLTERIQPELMTCFDVAAMGRYPYTGRFGALTERDRAIVQETLRRVRAEDIAKQDFSEISDGQRQRVLLARALCQEPDVLVLDEPTSYLDIRHKIELLDILLEEARERRMTVILSLHEIDLAEKISDLVMCVRKGAAYDPAPPQNVFSDERIAALYDISRGSYIVSRGSVELERPCGAPQVFVVGGNGCGVRHYRALQKRRIPFAAGVLFENDIECAVAKALASEVIAAPAFEPVSAEVEARARRLILECGAVIDARAPQGSLNAVNGELLALARERGLRVCAGVEELDIGGKN
ncbi:MAG: ABC transporter ATP-binding protein [Clostridia bacterium]|nr:ABC transporter ATP-binding protein [Clostridia bacterium]